MLYTQLFLPFQWLTINKIYPRYITELYFAYLLETLLINNLLTYLAVIDNAKGDAETNDDDGCSSSYKRR
jgi:hypothetical protein